ncbi:MAG: hypothetical protein OHK0046_29590 [Anaerolineae bacterium]
MADYFITPKYAEQVEMTTGIHRRTMAVTDEAMLCEFFLERNAIIAAHSHMNDQVGYVVYGRIEITINNETRECVTGDSYAIPGGIMHQARVLEDTLVIDVFSPPRNDYRTEAR